jgi:hypothetical protein
MVLAAFGMQIEERIIAAEARLEDRGTPIEEVERLARRFGLVADIQEPTIDEIRMLLAEGKLPLACIDRSVFDLTPQQRKRLSIRDAKMHMVVPSRVSAASVTFHDPLPPCITRKSIRLFRLAYERLGNTSVICSKPDTASPTDDRQ